MRDIELILRLLSERVITAKLNSGIQELVLLDAGDFKQWPLESGEMAGQSATMEEFFDRVA